MTLGTFTYISLVAEILWEMILVYNITLFKMEEPLFHWLTPSGIPPLWQTTDALHEPVPPHWPPQHTKLEILWLGLNINLCNSQSTPDSQAHRTVFCGKFGTHFAKYFKPEEFSNCKSAGLWWPICSSIQINLTELHQGKIILEFHYFYICVGLCWVCLMAAVSYEALPVYVLICYITAASNGYDFKFPWSLGKLDLSWLFDLPTWGRPQLQQHNTVLAVAQRVLRHSFGISLWECISSWQDSFTVDKFWSKSFVYSFTETKCGITPR